MKNSSKEEQEDNFMALICKGIKDITDISVEIDGKCWYKIKIGSFGMMMEKVADHLVTFYL